MKPYGLPQNHDVESPDMGDINFYALKSSTGNLMGKSGDYHNSIRNTQAKRKQRRKFKKNERQKAKIDIRRVLKEEEISTEYDKLSSDVIINMK